MTTSFTTSSPSSAASPSMGGVTSGPSRGPRGLFEALTDCRHELALRFMNSVADWQKYAPDIVACQADPTDYVRREFYVLIDYLALLFKTADPAYRALYIGEKVKQAYWEPESSAQQQHDRRELILKRDRQGIGEVLRDKISAVDMARLEAELNGIEAVITAKARNTLEGLFVGDCLFLDVMAFLVGPLLEDGVAVNPTFLTSKNPVELRNDLRKLADRKFDLVFFSPFTYEFAPEYARLMDWRQAASSLAKVRSMVDSALDSALPTVDLLAELFECNIFIHNSANVRRHDGSISDRLKGLATLRVRKAGRSRINERLADHVKQINAKSYDHLFVLDEMPLLNIHGEQELGRLFYDSDLQHPAAMGKHMAEVYRDVLSVHAQLLKKKLVVCDLDNTLWKGVIGEGAVEHYADRQRILKALVAKGVVLAINSKNDPKNVKWDGGVLSDADFVSSQINWENKVSNLKRISQHLNLKSKDFVFIDDRADEREMVNMSMPEVLTLDATSDRAWRLLNLWASYLSAQGETDRTQFYKQKEQRDSFLHQTAEAEDHSKLFEKLGIAVTVRSARKADLKRVAELINRTNQFNTCGSRTSVREATDWLSAGDRRILVVDCGDKFGTMGTICIAVVHEKIDCIEIPIFVLSCRVFGYGIETVVINVVKRLAQSKKLPIVAPFKETPHNEPCRKVYPSNGFIWDGSAWTYAGAEPAPDPSWLKITIED